MTGAAEETQRTQVRARPEVRKKDGGRLAGDGGVERGPGSLRARAGGQRETGADLEEASTGRGGEETRRGGEVLVGEASPGSGAGTRITSQSGPRTPQPRAALLIWRESSGLSSRRMGCLGERTGVGTITSDGRTRRSILKTLTWRIEAAKIVCLLVEAVSERRRIRV